MAYIERRCFDADAHIMEPSDWLQQYADPAVRDAMQSHRIPFDTEGAAAVMAKRQANPDSEDRARGRLLGEAYKSYGAFDGVERSRALDELGFDAQLIFPTFVFGQFWWGPGDDLIYGGARAYNRGITEWCSSDARLLPVGVTPFNNPTLAADEAERAIAEGCRAILVPTACASDMSPTHPDFDRFWSILSEADVPFMTHIGTGGALLPKGFRNNGKPIPPDVHGGGENIRSKDFVGVHSWPETFLSMLVLDGTFEKFPTLRGGCIEQGAEWAVTMMRRLDGTKRTFKNEPDLRSLPLNPSDYIRRQVKFTPFPHEDVVWIMEQAGAETVMFSSDYPHMEGTRDPVAKFEATMTGVSEANRDLFYAGNFAAMMGSQLAAV